MKKRVLSMLMTLALCLTLLPTPALAEGADAPEGGAIVQEEQQEQQEAPAAEPSTILEQAAENGIAAQNGGDSTVENAVAEVTVDGSTTTQYTDIAAAFTAAQGAESATVKLLENVTIPTDADSHSYGIKLTSGDIILDLNGHTIQTTGGSSGFVPLDAVFYIGGGSLTVQDSGAGGKIVQPNGGQAIGVSCGTLTVKSGIIEVTSDSAGADSATTQNCAVFVRGSGVADIQGGTLIGNRGIYIGGELSGGELTVSGGMIHGKSSYALEVVDGSAALSGGSYITGVSDGCSIWNAGGTAADLLASGYRYQDDNGKESAYSEDGKGVVGNATVALRPANEYAYIDKNGNPAKQTNCTEITERTDDISTPGWYVVKENLTISSLNISGEVNLILCDGATLTVTSFMNVTAGSTLNLFWQSAGSGKLTAAAISVLGTVTAPAGEMKQTTGEGGTTFEKCFEHDWGYTNNGDTHTAMCKLCGKAEAAESHKYDSWATTDANTHTGTCACGATKTEDHTLTCTPNADGLTHSTKCSVCGYTAAAESHDFNQIDGYGKKCACGAYLAAEYNGQQYATLARAIEAAKNGGTVTLARDVSENITVTGGTLTVDLNGKTWHVYENVNSNIIQKIPLTVTGGSVTLKNGTISQELPTDGKCGIQITGGSVTVEGDAVVIGSNKDGDAQLPPAPAIEMENGDLTLATGATLVYGLKVPEGKTLSDYLPAGTAFGLRSYDESTKTWTVDKSLLNAYTINNYAEHDMALVVVEHSAHDFKLNSDGKYTCACGYTCPHNDFKDGKCTICGNGCAHTDVGDDGVCRNCQTQMAVKITASDSTVTYSADFKSAMRNATNGTKITLLADVSIANRTGISGDGTTVTLDLNGHKITSGWLDVGGEDTNGTYTTCTLKIIGKGSYEPPMYGGIITVDVKATLDLSEWEGGTISSINISDNSNYEAATREAAVIVGPKAGTIGKLTFGNNQLPKITKTKLSGGSFNEIWAADHQPVKLGELLADGYAFQNGDGSYVEYGTTLKDASIYNVKVVKCLHPNMKPDETGVATCEYCGKSGKFVASVDGNLYIDMDEAISYWLTNSGTLKLYADYTAATEKATWTIVSGEHSIDLNGHRMSVKGDGAFKPTNNMHLTVTDGKEIGQIENILLDGNQGGSFTLENGYVCNLEMTDGAVVALKGGSVDNLDVQNSSVNTNLSIQGGSIGKLNIKDWADGMHVSATGGSLGAYNLPSGKILADVLDHQYYAEGTSLDRQVDTAQPVEKFVIKQAPYDFGSTSKAADVPINGSIPFMVDSPSENVGVYEVKWYRRTNSGAEHMTENRVADVNVNDTLDVFCVITGLDRPGGAMQWQVAVKDYTIKVVPAKLNGDQTVIRQKPNTGNTGNSADNRLVVTPFSSSTFNDVEYKFEVTYNRQPLELNKDYTIKDSSNLAKNAGTHTLTIVGIGNYTGEKSVTWTLEPYELSVENYCHAQINKTYDGTDAVTDSTNGINGLGGFMLDSKNPRNPRLLTVDKLNLDKSDYELSNMKFDSAEAGDRTFTGTMTLKPDGNFVFANGSRVMQIEYGSGGGNRQFVVINREIIAAPAAKALQVANNHAATYTVDLSALLPKLESPKKYGEVTYELGTDAISFTTAGYYDATKGNAEVKDDKLILPIQAVETDTTGNIGSVKVKVFTTNYHDFTLTINVSAKNQIRPTPDGEITATPITYGDTLSKSEISGTMKDPDTGDAVNGTFAWKDGTIKPAANDSYEAEWIFTPDASYGGKYTTNNGTATVTVNPKAVTVSITSNGGTYGGTINPATATANDVVGEDNPEITLTYTGTANDGTEYNGTTPPTKAGTYTIKASTTNANYTLDANTATAKFTVAKRRATVTPDNKSKVYEENDPKLNYKVSGVLDGETLKGITLARAEGENAGEYDITGTADAGANPNYDVTFAKGTFTIKPKSIKGATVVLGKGLAANGAEQTQTVEKVLLGDKEIPADSYTVTGNTATAHGIYTLTITAKGNYTDSIAWTYVIAPSKAEDAPGEDITIGSGKVKVDVQSEGAVPPIGLLTDKAELFVMLVNSCDITADELVQISNGASVDIVLTVKEANVPDAVKTAMAQAAKDYTIGQYLDISLFKYMTVNGSQQAGVALHTTKDALTISVVVPDALINTNSAVNRTYCIVRNHEGAITVLDAAFDAAGKTLTFKTDRFSIYAIAYKDTAVPRSSKPSSNNSSNDSETKKNEVASPTPAPTPASTSKPSTITAMPQTGDTSNPTLYVVLLVASLLGLAVVFVCKKRNDK